MIECVFSSTRCVSIALFDSLREAFVFWYGAIAQLGERVLCKHEVVGSIPSGSTSLRWLRQLRLGKPIVAKAAASKLERAKTG